MSTALYSLQVLDIVALHTLHHCVCALYHDCPTCGTDTAILIQVLYRAHTRASSAQRSILHMSDTVPTFGHMWRSETRNVLLQVEYMSP